MDPNVLHNLSYGMYIVSSVKGKAMNAQVVNTAFQITSEPITIAIDEAAALLEQAGDLLRKRANALDESADA